MGGSCCRCYSTTFGIKWAAASNDISLNAMILPVALYFWKIPHFMALAYLCRDDFAAGGFKMYSLADASGHRISLVALGNSMYLIPLGFLAYDCVQKQKNAASAGAKLFCFPGPSLIQIQLF
ncbi:protoheme IX farnesyltransferase, mitochondrial-like [Glycine soja]|uniref:protoheme IX farnesyltransferase, mitochondrial-like n=1 Tax=Glycine soja TaxID=3848 RepID=UPI00071925FA|nr:protoheme IX farnesyltransferase, mitochondrial isoform X1 [Glycine max]XP_014618939.1 protoheme IX farnesyltransferase, mitochondrial isoform X1 [Glycine max]XP_028182602.1 protoheme IX farnesyltransferase, mitochondrial-like [Glycine soja]XP_028182603.1 protoheme IX farnesyltransferase, mitochondrial-like [Glycine soja]XP_028182604.1 protoheme IX farnesyltransferase, mitochondrial-like [Glycine soja]|eukprot:XP_014618938.1 protoheme IX farnesyltransferase, mitochondrial [Glycine max]